jgi:DUF971 family protein
MSAPPVTAWPTEIRVKSAEKAIEVAFDDGQSFRLDAEYLRVESPSAEVQGHGAGQRQFVPGCAAVGIAGVEPVGNYAIRIRFDDGHDTGIFTWRYLHQLGLEREQRWRDYLAGLARAGLSREARARK